MDSVALKRYSRQTMLSSIGVEGQEKLINSKVLIVGLGGLGTGVSMYLVRMGVGHIGVIDSDVVDVSNLQRQILYDESDIGVSKIKTGVRKLKNINSNLIVDEYDYRLTDDNATEIISKYDLVVDCTDNYTVRAIINRVCTKLKISCVFGAVNEFNGFIFTYVPGSACFECFMGEYKKLVEMDKTNKVVGIVGAMVGIISSMQALEAMKVLLKIKKLSTNKVTIVDGCDLSISTIPICVKEECHCVKGE